MDVNNIKICQFCSQENNFLIDLTISYWNNISSIELLKFSIPELVHKIQANTSIHVCQNCLQYLATFALFKKNCLNSFRRVNNSTEGCSNLLYLNQLQAAKEIPLNTEINNPIECLQNLVEKNNYMNKNANPNVIPILNNESQYSSASSLPHLQIQNQYKINKNVENEQINLQNQYKIKNTEDDRNEQTNSNENEYLDLDTFSSIINIKNQNKTNQTNNPNEDLEHTHYVNNAEIPNREEIVESHELNSGNSNIILNENSINTPVSSVTSNNEIFVININKNVDSNNDNIKNIKSENVTIENEDMNLNGITNNVRAIKTEKTEVSDNYDIFDDFLKRLKKSNKNVTQEEEKVIDVTETTLDMQINEEIKNYDTNLNENSNNGNISSVISKEEVNFNSNILKHIKLEKESNEDDVTKVIEVTKQIKVEENNDDLINEFIKRVKKNNGNCIIEDEKIIIDVNDDEELLEDLNVSKEMKKLIVDSFKEEEPTCPFCKKIFIDKYYYKKYHIRIHVNCNVKCPICEKVIRKAHLKEHTLLHNSEKTFKCPLCPEMFKTRTQVSTHKTRTHIKDASVPCPICSKIIKNEYRLTNHLKIHNENRPHVCSTCNKSYKCRRELKRHEAIHDPNIIFKCTICSKIFKRRSNLRIHMHSHANGKHVCLKCDKVFKSPLSLKSHSKLHKPEKYKCTTCSKGFTRPDYLDKHLLIHKDEKPHKCSKCKSAFKRKDNLKSHYKRLHKD